jgi:predicted branched-subunit amino acid permease
MEDDQIQPEPRRRRHLPDDEDDRPRRRRDDDDDDDVDVRRIRRSSSDDETQFIVPTNVSAWSLVACYAGFIGMCLPLAGLAFAIPAFICGIIALRKRKKATSYGAITSDIRAVLGLVFSSIALLLWGGVLVMVFISSLK